ncbi:VWDE protein, partial [Polypterus senegalus]
MERGSPSRSAITDAYKHDDLQNKWQPNNRRRRQNYYEYVSSFPYQSLSQTDLEGFSYFFPEDHTPNSAFDTVPSWPTPSGLTESKVAELCQHTVANSSIGKGCGVLLGKRVMDVIDMCILDIQLKDDISWSTAGLPLLENECERKLIEQSHSKEYNSLLSLLKCPNLCNGNGECAEWGCVCYPGYGAYDCSIVSDQPPEIIELENAGFCDVRQYDCSSVRIFGQGFKDSPDLKCEVIKEQFISDEWSLGDPQLTTASFLSNTVLDCQLPRENDHSPHNMDIDIVDDKPLARWQIKVSNDGYEYSNSKTLTLFDGACQICEASSDGLCSLKWGAHQRPVPVFSNQSGAGRSDRQGSDGTKTDDYNDSINEDFQEEVVEEPSLVEEDFTLPSAKPMSSETFQSYPATGTSYSRQANQETSPGN